MSAALFPLSACPRIVYDLIINNARLYPMSGHASPATQSCLAISDGRIAAIGETGEARETIDANGACLLPGFIDCHTHAVYAGDRADEHAARMAGASYPEIARGGGGILTTVRAVAVASEQELVDGARPRLATLLAEGVTTIEIKSGYGLDTANEIKMLRVIRQLGTELPMKVIATFLGAHTIPGKHSHESYMGLVVDEMLPAAVAEKLADAVDIFVENIAFTVADMERLFAAASAHGLKLRAHTEQLSNMGASARAAELGALSCDHLEHLDEPGVRAMASAGSVAVLLPGAFYFLGETRLPLLISIVVTPSATPARRRNPAWQSATAGSRRLAKRARRAKRSMPTAPACCPALSIAIPMRFTPAIARTNMPHAWLVRVTRKSPVAVVVS